MTRIAERALVAASICGVGGCILAKSEEGAQLRTSRCIMHSTDYGDAPRMVSLTITTPYKRELSGLHNSSYNAAPIALRLQSDVATPAMLLSPNIAMAKRKQKRKNAKGNFWTPRDKQAFHEAAAKLCKQTSAPGGGAIGYRQRKVDCCQGYELSCEEELHLADHIAFLAPAAENARTITAATIQEHNKGRKLVILLAANVTPEAAVVKGLQAFMEIVAKYASTG